MPHVDFFHLMLETTEQRDSEADTCKMGTGSSLECWKINPTSISSHLVKDVERVDLFVEQFQYLRVGKRLTDHGEAPVVLRIEGVRVGDAVHHVVDSDHVDLARRGLLGEYRL